MIATNWETYTSWLFNIEDIGMDIPRVSITSRHELSIFDDEGAIFLNPSKHWWATWASIKPKH